MSYEASFRTSGNTVVAVSAEEGVVDLFVSGAPDDPGHDRLSVVEAEEVHRRLGEAIAAAKAETALEVKQP